MPKLVRKTKDLIIRPLQKSDYLVWKEYFLTYDGPKNLWDTMTRSHDELSKSDFNNYINRKRDDFITVHAFEKKSGKMVGAFFLMSIIRGISQSCFLGYGIHHNFWGKGYGKQSVRAVIEIAFKDVGLHRIEAGIEPYNRRSIMLARSLGLRKEGLKKRAIFKRGEWQDLVIYSATCEEFGIKWKQKNLEVRI